MTFDDVDMNERRQREGSFDARFDQITECEKLKNDEMKFLIVMCVGQK